MLLFQIHAIRHSICAARIKWTFRLCSSYTHTILLPKTEFPLRINTKKRVERDLWIANETSFDGLYTWQRNQIREEEFILHDGPPYANGNPHMGHALNKILKDITIRYHLLTGKKIHYVPGWDCHGLPIEHKVLQSTKTALSHPTDIRNKAKLFATDTIKTQKTAFRRWGVMADWDNNCYYTFLPEYVTSQLKSFYEMYEKGLVFRDYKPVYWSPSSKTALAESELEYDPQHKSPSLYLKLALQKPLPPFLKVDDDVPVYIVVWTTTPWTLPANQAVCFDGNKNYSLTQTSHHGTKQYWIVASELVEILRQKWSTSLETVSEFQGDALKGTQYTHPVRKTELLPLLAANHVTMTKGTGFVHTAPAHGPEDFLVALQHQIPVKSLVDEGGRYNDETGCGLIGLEVLGQGQEAVLKLVQDDIVHLETFEHSYPYDWRTKLPVILRASLQWFIDTDAIKHQALEAMNDVTVIPANMEKPMLNQLATRPYWCISRQRSWGVPIPVFYDSRAKTQKEAVINKDIISRLCTLMAQEGADLWWQRSADELIGDELLSRLGIESGQLQKGQDIMDIWFDSGISWNSVLPSGKPADLYLEGIDQFRGWFQSSLLTSVALTGRAPYKKLFVHGFALDAEGRKMSKSLGNVIDPKDIVDGDGKKKPAYGVDVLRWWTASHVTGNGTNMSISSTLIQQAAEDVQKMRAIFRFILGNLQDISQVDLDQVNITDRYMLHLLSEFVSNALKSYEEMNYKKIVSLSQPFINSQISAFYCQIVKDRLYCHAINTISRRSAVFVLNEMLKHTTLILAPLLPHLTEEVYLYHPQRGQEGLFRNGKLSPLPIFRCPEAAEWMKPALAVRETVNQLVGAGSTKIWHVDIVANPQDYDVLQKFQTEETSFDSDLCEILQVSGVTLHSAESCSTANDAADIKKFQIHQSGPIDVKLSQSQLKACLRCRRFTSVDGSLCPSCVRMTS